MPVQSFHNMSTYDGKSGSYVPGKEPPNKEPPVSKYVVEKLYRVHRNRILNVAPMVDCHVHIPDFLIDQSWKKLAAQHREGHIRQHNEEIYRRIAKLENQESKYTSENREHIKRVEHEVKLMNRLKEVGRLRKLMRIEKENEHFMKRLERARPEYTLKGCKEWYKHHDLFKKGRRSEPTAGHIMTGMSGLLPGPLPPIDPSKLSSISRTHGGLAGASSIESLRSPSFLAMDSIISQNIPSIADGITRSLSGTLTSPTAMVGSIENYESTASVMLTRNKVNSSHRNRSPKTGSRGTEGASSRGDNSVGLGDNSINNSLSGGGSLAVGSAGIRNTFGPSNSKRFDLEADASEGEDNNSSDDDLDPAAESYSDMNSTQESEAPLVGADGKIVILSRPFAIPFDSKNCVVQICASRMYDENIYLRVCTSNHPMRVYSERPLPIDVVYKIFNTVTSSSGNIVRAAKNEDLQSLRALLINMFREADRDNNGYLTFDEFQELMEKVDLGISSEELRFVISEADENENGVVDYDEFVPLAVDMIQSFKARNRAKKLNNEENNLVTDQVLKTLSHKELENITKMCLDKIQEVDSKKYGIIRLNELRRCLNQVSACGLTDTEISMICQLLPRDPFGRCVYGSFHDVLAQVRFMTLKNTIVESQGSDMQKYLVELCRDEESKIKILQGGDDFTTTGIIPFRTFINILSNSPRLSLSRLQVMVIMAEASVQDGMVNYYEFIPQVAKTIEFMFEPKSLRQRAELIETTDLSPEALLQGMSTAEFEHKLLTLFKSHDVDHNGFLDEAEFISCLQSLELQLSKGELIALMATADVSNTGSLKFEDFMVFFSHNLIHLEREKHIRILQSSIHNKAVMIDGQPTTADGSIDSYMVHLLPIFKLADVGNTGYLHLNEFEDVMKSLDVRVSAFELETLLSEITTDQNGFIDYKQFIPVCAELLEAFRANELAIESRAEREEWAQQKATKLVQSSIGEIHQIVRFLKQRIFLIEETIEDTQVRYATMQEMLHNPHSGLSKQETNIICAKLFVMGPSTSGAGAGRHGNSGHATPSNVAHSTGARGGGTPQGAAPGSVSKNSRGRPMLISDLTVENLTNIVVDARKTSIMRNLLQDPKPTEMKSHLVKLLEREAKRLVLAGTIEEDSQFIPVDECYKVLESAAHLRLHRPQIIAIVSMADCFDDSGFMLNYKKFAEHAASVIARICDASFVDIKTQVLDMGTVNDRAVMHGLKEKDMDAYFIKEFTAVQLENGEVTQENFVDVISKTPKINISERDAVAIASAFPHTSTGTVHWKEFVPWAHDTIKSLCKERMVDRRIALLTLSASQQAQDAAQDGHSVDSADGVLDENSPLKSLAEKLMEFVKIRQQGDSVLIVLPIDNATRRTVVGGEMGGGDFEICELFKTAMMIQMTAAPMASKPSTAPSRGISFAIQANSFSQFSPGKFTSLGSGVGSVSLGVVGAGELSAEAAAAVVQKVRNNANKRTLPVLLKVLSVDSICGDKELVVHIINMDCGYCESVKLPIKLPSIGQVDRDVANQMAKNLVDVMYIEYDSTCSHDVSKFKLKLLDSQY